MGRHRSTGFWLGLGLAALIATSAHATDLSGIEPFVGRATFERLLVDLEVPDDSGVVASVLYDDYLDALTTACEQRRVLRARAGGDRLEAALSGAVFLDADELRALRRAVHDTERSAWPVFDEAAAELIDGVASLSNAARTEAARRDVRRRMWLEPRRAAAGVVGFAGDGVDVIVLVAESAEDGGPLATLAADEFAVILDDYAARMDTWLSETAAAHRQERWNLEDARLAADAEGRREAERALVKRWSGYGLHASAVDAIAGLARSRLGDEPADVWRDRFDEACFPAVYRRDTTEQYIAWIRGHVEDESVRRAVDEIAVDHAQRQRIYRREAVRILLVARVGDGVVLTVETRPDAIENREVRALHMDLLKNSGERAALDREMSSRIAALLDESVRRRMTRAVRAAS